MNGNSSRRWWVARYAFVLALFAWGIGFYGPAVFLQALHAGRGWAIAEVSRAITLHFLCGAAIVWWLPELHRRFGLWHCTAMGVVCAALGASAWAHAATPWQLLPAALLSAWGWALISGAALNAIVTPWFDDERPRALALAFNGASVGGLLFTPLWTAAIAALGFATAAAAIGAAALVLLLPAGALLLRSGPPSAAVASGTGTTRRSRGELLRERRFFTLSVPFALALFAQIGLLSHLIARLAPAFGAGIAALAVSLVAACAVLGRSLLARGLGRGDRRRAAALNVGVQALGTVLLMSGESALALGAGCVLFGLGFGNLTSLPPLIAQQDFEPADVPTVVALVTALNQALFALAPALLGLLHDATASYRGPFALALAAQVLAMAILLARPASR